MPACDWWSMMSICECGHIFNVMFILDIWLEQKAFLISFSSVDVQSSGTSRIDSPGQWLPSSGRTALYRSTAKTTLICSSTCVALSVAFCQSVVLVMRSSPTRTEFGTCRMRWEITDCCSSNLKRNVQYTLYLRLHIFIFLCAGDQRENSAVFPESGWWVNAALPQQSPSDFDGIWLHHIY